MLVDDDDYKDEDDASVQTLTSPHHGALAAQALMRICARETEAADTIGHPTLPDVFKYGRDGVSGSGEGSGGFLAGLKGTVATLRWSLCASAVGKSKMARNAVQSD